jgi:hypothetical protein
MASLHRSLTWRQLFAAIVALWILIGLVSLALTYLGGSHGVGRPPVQRSVHR